MVDNFIQIVKAFSGTTPDLLAASVERHAIENDLKIAQMSYAINPDTKRFHKYSALVVFEKDEEKE